MTADEGGRKNHLFETKEGKLSRNESRNESRGLKLARNLFYTNKRLRELADIDIDKQLDKNAKYLRHITMI